MATNVEKIGEDKVKSLFDSSYDTAIEKVITQFESPSKEDNQDTQREQVCHLAHHVVDCFNKSEAARLETESKWIDALRQYKGVYPDETISKISPNRSKAFRRITRNKVKTMDSRLSDLLFPSNGDLNWSIGPTPLPELSERKLNIILEMYYQDTGEMISPAELQVLMHDVAVDQATKMTRVISDQLAELKYHQIMRDVLHSGHVYGTGILKGPLVTISENKQYYKKVKTSGGKSKWILQEFDEITPFLEYVPVWDIYPDMDATNLSDCRYVIQRRKMDKHEIIGLAKRADFDAEVITGYLAKFSSGDYRKKNYETSLSTLGDITYAGDSVITTSHGDTISTNSPRGYLTSEKRYEVLEYWGYVDAEDLEQMGVDIPCDKKGYMELAANVWVLGNKVIKASLSPIEGVKWPYFFYYYDKDETSIFGEGIPDVIKDDQAIVNTAMRMILDNAAISAGPQIEVNMDLVAELEDIQDIYPFKVWPRTGAGPDAQNRAIQFLDFPNYTGNLAQIMDIGSQGADESSAIPKYMWGEGSGNVARTASGLSMLMGSANIAIKDQVKNFDEGITKPFITAMYFWNMQYNEDEDIKGDYAVVAQGSSSLIQKEVLSERLMQFAQVASNPMFMSITHAAPLFREIAKALDFEDEGFVMTDEEIQAQQAQQQAEAEAAREERYMIVEAARREGTSPEAMLDNIDRLRREYQEPMPTSGDSPAGMMAQMEAQEQINGPQ